MSKKLIYIDQNIIGLLLHGYIKLPHQSEFLWVYSKEHFSEMKRSETAEKYLRELERIDAKLLDLEMDSAWQLTGNARLVLDGTPTQHYDAHIQSINEVDFDETSFDPLQAWINGGGSDDLLRGVSEQVAEQILMLTKGHPEEGELLFKQFTALKPKFDNLTDQLRKQGNDISRIREAIGDKKGKIGSVKGGNKLEKIWQIVAPYCSGLTCNQFFGFDTIEKDNNAPYPGYLGIIKCCSVLDILGFQAEKKCRKIEKLPNVRSDAAHIGMGAYCSAILSEDHKLINRATAIYEYLGVGTCTFLVKKQNAT